MSRNLRALVTKNSMKERFRTAQTYLQKLKFLVDDVGVFSTNGFYLLFERRKMDYNMIFPFFSLNTRCPMSLFGLLQMANELRIIAFMHEI